MYIFRFWEGIFFVFTNIFCKFAKNKYDSQNGKMSFVISGNLVRLNSNDQ